MAFDFKKEQREFYLPKRKPEIIKVPKMSYIADSCPIFSSKGFEHTVSHYIVEVIEYRHVVCKSVVVIQSMNFCVVLV